MLTINQVPFDSFLFYCLEIDYEKELISVHIPLNDTVLTLNLTKATHLMKYTIASYDYLHQATATYFKSTKMGFNIVSLI